ncbi:hypothetical protein BASA62_007455 [Batrachochytrium salamandrivorans]|nr:hypothetical protein BASA62_007455 [Batrachochytrium salamandrivorans]
MMVSEFLCKCHGPMRLSVSQQLAHPSVLSETLCVIKPGKNADGYWTNKDLAEQLEFRAIPIFKILHPNCIRLFLFDNSMNHHAFAPDALKSVGLPLKDEGKNMKKMRNGWFEIDAKRYSRRNCDYSFKGLGLVLPAALNSVSLTLIRKYARKYFRYMDAYRARNDIGNGLTMEQVEYAMKKYAGHRHIPQSIMHEFDK